MKPIAVRLPWPEPFTLIPGCCIHYPLGEKDLLKAWVDRIASDPSAYTVLLGDSMDLGRRRFTKYVKGYNDDETSLDQFDDMARAQCRELAKILQPIKRKILGGILGNHYWEYSNGVNTEQTLAELLGYPYLGVTAAIRCDFARQKIVRGQQVYSTEARLTIFGHHSMGGGGGRSTSGDVAGLLKGEKVIDADIYCAGHTHRAFGIKERSLRLTERTVPPRVNERPVAFLRAGAMLKTFAEDEPTATKRHVPSYGEHALYRPADLGWVECAVTWKSEPDSEGGRGRVIPQFRITY